MIISHISLVTTVLICLIEIRSNLGVIFHKNQRLEEAVYLLNFVVKNRCLESEEFFQKGIKHEFQFSPVSDPQK